MGGEERNQKEKKGRGEKKLERRQKKDIQCKWRGEKGRRKREERLEERSKKERQGDERGGREDSRQIGYTINR